jgi:murein DD-endopeptidase MepM/ murein hydrolase activator NlpD
MFGSPRRYKPFLRRIFPKAVHPDIVEGWIYGAEETAIYGGYDRHHGIDFATPMGTPVLAAAEGWALASFEEVPIRYPGNEVRMWRGSPIFWGLGLFVAILHKNGLVTYYGHLHRLSDPLQEAYRVPQDFPPDVVVPPFATLRAEDFQEHRACYVHAGDRIGYTGITGMGKGTRTYDNWRTGMPYTVNDEEHLHFAVSSLPALAAGTVFLDPFAKHAYASDYPKYTDNWRRLPNSLWVE